MKTLEDIPFNSFELNPVGYELLYDNAQIVPDLGSLACLNRIGTDPDTDDIMTGGKMDDPYIGDDPTLFADPDEIYSLQ